MPEPLQHLVAASYSASEAITWKICTSSSSV
jgi:hypothetical protein